MKLIRLLLVDDHDIVRTGLRSFLEIQPGLEVVAEASTGSEALARAEETRPDVAIMDISLPGMDGVEATRRLKALLPECQVLALTVHEERQFLLAMLAEGATGYVTKQAAADELVAAVRAVAQGQCYFQPPMACWLLEDYRRLLQQARPAVSSALEKKLDGDVLALLSAREQEVIELVAEGLNNLRIGEKLGISPKTVARHRERVMRKLDLHSSTELVKFAIRHGLAHVH
jgi:DNA-binding NarL/FixJ family response regulator